MQTAAFTTSKPCLARKAVASRSSVRRAMPVVRASAAQVGRGSAVGWGPWPGRQQASLRLELGLQRPWGPLRAALFGFGPALAPLRVCTSRPHVGVLRQGRPHAAALTGTPLPRRARWSTSWASS